MANIFFIGDTHFGHKRILEFEPVARPFTTIEEHDEVLVDNWNKVVSKRDVVYHLGDVYFGHAENYNLLGRLKGIKHLILGNHDSKRVNHLKDYFQTLQGVGKFDGNSLTHIPIHPSQFYRFKCNIHGHLHSDLIRLANLEPDARYINVSCEHTNLAPISYDELIRKWHNG